MQHPDNQTNEQKLSQLMDGEWLDLNPSECVAALCKNESLQTKWSRYHMIRDVLKNEPVVADLDLASRICAAIDDEPSYTNITPFNAASGASSNFAALHDTVQNAEQVDDLAEEEPTNDSIDTDITSIDERRSVAKSNSTFKTGLTGFALAASVALVTVVGMNIWQSQSTDKASSIASATPRILIDSASATPRILIDSASATPRILIDSASVTPRILIDSASATPRILNDSAGATPRILNDGNGVFALRSEAMSLPVVEFVSNTGSYWVSPETTERVIDEQRLNMMLSQHIENSPTSDREGLLPYSRLVGYDERGVE